MREYQRFIDESKALFSMYEVVDGDSGKNPNNIKKRRIAIIGKYNLNRECQGITYVERFDIEVRVSKTNASSSPKVRLLCDIPKGFYHVYPNGDSCLGLEHEIVAAWGPNYDAVSFFENVVDVYLINFVSFRDRGEFVTGERPHGSEGMVDYYSKFFPGVSSDGIEDILKHIEKKVSRNKVNGRHIKCPCGSEKDVIECHEKDIKTFIAELKTNETLKNAFIEDQEKKVKKKGRARNVKSIEARSG